MLVKEQEGCVLEVERARRIAGEATEAGHPGPPWCLGWFLNQSIMRAVDSGVTFYISI